MVEERGVPPGEGNHGHVKIWFRLALYNRPCKLIALQRTSSSQTLRSASSCGAAAFEQSLVLKQPEHQLHPITRAAERNKPRRAGHVEGARRAGEAVEACRQLGVEVGVQSKTKSTVFGACMHACVHASSVRFPLV